MATTARRRRSTGVPPDSVPDGPRAPRSTGNTLTLHVSLFFTRQLRFRPATPLWEGKKKGEDCLLEQAYHAVLARKASRGKPTH